MNLAYLNLVTGIEIHEIDSERIQEINGKIHGD